MDIGNIFEEWDFSGTVPLPYRVLLMGCIGIFAWASNLHILSYLRVDVSNLLFSSPPLSGIYTNHPRHSRDKFVNKSSPLSALYRSIYALGMAFLTIVLINMWMYKWVVSGSEANGQKNAGVKTESKSPATVDIRGGMGLVGNPRAGIMVPIVGYMTVIIMIFVPFNVLFKKDRYRFLRSMKKALFSGFTSEVTFADVILADILTSFARVFGDLAVALCLILLDRDGTYADACYGSILVPIMTSIPYCIRLRQCLSEYIESNYTTERHLMNALKYASAFPVIIISSMQKSSKAASLKGLPYDGYFSDNSLFKLWLFFVALNSFYSFYWDIYHDWNLIQTYPVVRTPTLTIDTSSVSSSESTGIHSHVSGPLSPATPKVGSNPLKDISSFANGSAGTSSGGTSSSNSKALLSPLSSNSNNNPLSNSGAQGSNSTIKNGSNSTLKNGSNSTLKNGSNASYSKKQLTYGVRSFLHYEDQWFYIMAVALDFLLRTTWMLKLVSDIQIEEYEGGVFTMECLEVLRRWIWVLFRLESEMVKRAGYMDTMPSPLFAAGLAGNTAGDASMSDSGMENGDMIMMDDMESWQK
ncbi:EXS family-domain-containing protein [Dissophora ornata]|nr:protein-ER retention protein [Dissophora ornata]KAI8605399.1 EXS family-domain-containing protein [Dissophora ornata]